MTDLYEMLGVTRDVSPKELKAAYHKLAVKYHPDKNSDSAVKSIFQNITRAYNILKDPHKRAEYDKGGIGKAEETQTTKEQLVKQTLMQHFSTVISGTPVTKLVNVDVIGLVDKQCVKVIIKAKKDLIEMMKGARSIQALVKRFKVDEEGFDNIFATVLESQKRNIESNIEKCRRALVINVKARNYLSHIKFDFEEKTFEEKTMWHRINAGPYVNTTSSTMS